jgi:hypothetical protein
LFEQQLQQAIKNQFVGGKGKDEEKKESPSKLCTFKSIRLTEKNSQLRIPNFKWPDEYVQQYWLEGD